MKYFALIITLLACAHLKAQWSFDVVDNGNSSQVGELFFPVSYRHSNCDFSFSVWDGSNFDDIRINNLNGCTTDDHFIVIDDHAYLMPNGFVLDFYSDQWSTFDFVSLGSCSTVSGSPILTGAPNLFLGGQFFQINTSERLEIKSFGPSTFFLFNSMNGDVTCTNGVSYLDLTELIFKGGFE